MDNEESTDDPPDLAILADAVLLDRFVEHEDDVAFRTLVERHGPLVLSVCRRSLSSLADADDAFQATFLVLAQSARKIRNRESLAAWLYGVATRVSIRMRRRLRSEDWGREIQQMAEPAIEHDPLDELLARHDARVADEELAALPMKLRTPLVLRYLAGKSNAEVADELGITIAALEGRLKRGKQRLRMKLIRRGILLTTLVSTLKTTQIAACELPISLVEKTTQLCTTTGVSSLLASSATDSPITHFAQEELIAMKSLMIAKPLVVAAAMSGVMVLAVVVQMAIADGEPATGRVALQAEAGPAVDAAEAEQAPPVIHLSRKEEAELESAPSRAGNKNRLELDALDMASQGQDHPQLFPSEPPKLPFPTTASRSPSKQFADAKPRSDSEQRIEAALVQQLTSVGLDFTDTPLEEIVEFLSDEYDIEIHLDTPALDEFGIGPDEPVTVNLRNIKLNSAMRLMLRSLKITFIVNDEVLLITTPDVAESTLETRIYPLSSGAIESKLLTETIEKMIAPDSWAPSGGEGEIVALGKDRLVIRQTYANHAQINELLLQLNQPASGD